MSLTDTYTLKLTEREYSMLQVSVWKYRQLLKEYVKEWNPSNSDYEDPEWAALQVKLADTTKWRDEK